MEKRWFNNTTISQISLITGLLLTIALAPQTVQAAKFYKWVDDNGVVRYGDRMPPTQAKKRQEILNDQGMVIETRAAAKTKQQIVEEQKRQKLAAEEKRLKEAQAAKDRVLLDTYSSEEDIITVRDSKIDAIDGSIRLAQSRISKGHQKLAESKKEAAQIERSGKPVPDNLTLNIKNARSQIRDNEAFIERQNKERAEVVNKHEYDLTHYRELMQKADKSQMTRLAE